MVQDGIVPGLWGYEAGQAGVGDLFAWYIEEGIPPYVHAEAKAAGMSLFQWLERHAASVKPGQSGLLALDWWSGCRSVLMDSQLTGMILGHTTSTKPPEIYRGLIEATAFGSRKIIEAFEAGGIAINEIFASGGLAQKSPLLMQVYADVTNRTLRLAASEHTSALGAAIQAAVAAGAYPDIHAAATKMARLSQKIYKPNPKNTEIYNQLYAEYIRLHDLFGRDGNSTMKRLLMLKRLRSEGVWPPARRMGGTKLGEQSGLAVNLLGCQSKFYSRRGRFDVPAARRDWAKRPAVPRLPLATGPKRNQPLEGWCTVPN